MEHTTMPNENFKRFEIPVKMGLLIAIIKIIFSTIQYQFFLGSLGMSSLVGFISFTLGVILFCMTGIQQRKAMGGYIDIKQAFQAIFVAILIVVALNTVYDFIYIKFIDPGMMAKVQESALSFAERMGAPQETLDDMAEKFDQQEQDKTKLSKQLLSFCTQLVWYGIVGFICAAIVKKKKPIM